MECQVFFCNGLIRVFLREHQPLQRLRVLLCETRLAEVVSSGSPRPRLERFRRVVPAEQLIRFVSRFSRGDFQVFFWNLARTAKYTSSHSSVIAKSVIARTSRISMSYPSLWGSTHSFPPFHPLSRHHTASGDS